MKRMLIAIALLLVIPVQAADTSICMQGMAIVTPRGGDSHVSAGYMEFVTDGYAILIWDWPDGVELESRRTDLSVCYRADPSWSVILEHGLVISIIPSDWSWRHAVSGLNGWSYNETRDITVSIWDKPEGGRAAWIFFGFVRE